MGISRLPFASFFVGTIILTLSACGGQPLVFNANPPADSSSSSAPDASSQPNSSSLIASSSQATVSSSSQTTVSNSSQSISSTQSSSLASSVASSSIASSALTGKQLYDSATLGCSACHGLTGDGGSSDTPIVGSQWATPSLVSKIQNQMPQQTGIYVGVHCDLTCAQKIAAYIKGGYSATASELPSLRLKPAASSASTASLLAGAESSCGLAYSTYNLRTLNKQEYSDAIFQLTGIDLINELGQTTYDTLPVNSLSATTLDKETQQSYNLMANKIADNLLSKNFAGTIDCANVSSEQCYNLLIDDFSCKAFRRPLTDAERSNYLATYTSGSDGTQGIRKVAAAVLASPNFVYRSDIGLALLYREDNAAIALALASAGSLINENKTIAANQSYSLNSYFSGSDLLEISLKSTQNAGGSWPIVRVQLGDSTFVDLIANQADATYKFRVTGLSGYNSITIANQSTGAPLEYQANHSLTISSIKVALSY